MVIDGHGRGQVVSFAFVKCETQHYIHRIFDAFVSSSVEACDKIKVVLTDKDFVEQQVIKTVLPHVSLQLCLFNVLRAFNRGISECNLSSEQRDRVCSIFEQLVYTDTPSEFDDLLRQLQAFPAAFAYYSRCWDVCKDQWAQCNTRHRVTFGVRTNNYVESQNQKIKFLLSHKVPFCESIDKLLKLFELQYHEHQQRNSEAVCKKTYIHNSKLPAEFCSKLTVFALKEVNRQLAKASLWVDSSVSFTATDGQLLVNDKMYAITDTSCSCSFFTSFRLTCAHLFFLRLKNGESLCHDGDFANMSRWTVQYAAQETTLQSTNSTVTLLSNRGHVRSKTEKYRFAMAMFKPLADELSECGEAMFKCYMHCCEDLIKHIKCKEPCFVSSGSMNDDNSTEMSDIVEPVTLATSSVQADDQSNEESAAEQALETDVTWYHDGQQPEVLSGYFTDDIVEILGEEHCTDSLELPQCPEVMCQSNSEATDFEDMQITDEMVSNCFDFDHTYANRDDVNRLDVHCVTIDTPVADDGVSVTSRQLHHSGGDSAGGMQRDDAIPETEHSSNEQRDSSEVINLEVLRTAKLPLPSKSRGRPKGTKQFRCSGAVAKVHPKEVVLKYVAKDYVSIEDVVHLRTKIDANDIKTELPKEVLQVSWNRYKHLFTTAAFDLLTAVQKGLQNMLNTCPVCKIEYADGASMVGCDVCGYWYHFACVGLRRAPPRKRDWFCPACLCND